MKVSVIVRSHNDASVIGRTLEMLLRQKGSFKLEFLSCDDNSSDGTAEIIAGHPEFIRVPFDGGPYNPARTLNRAAALATGEMIVFNNSDAVPLCEDYLEKLLTPLADKKTGAVFGNQLARPDAFVLVRKDNLRAFGDGGEAAKWRHMFSLVSAAARRSTVQQFPFDEAFCYSEDIDWSLRLKRAGLRIEYAPGALVEHSHNYTSAELERRFYNEGIANAMLWPEDKPSFHRFLLATLREMVRDVVFEFNTGNLDKLMAGLAYRWHQRYCAYRGERDHRAGRVAWKRRGQ